MTSKRTFRWLQCLADNTGLSSFVEPLYMPAESAKSRKITRKFDLTSISVRGHPRSSYLVPIESTYATSYYSSIVTSDYHVPFSKYWHGKLENCPFSLLHSVTLVWSHAKGEPVRICGWNLCRKTRGKGLVYSENFVILTSTVFGWSTLVTDRRTEAISDVLG